MSRNLIIGGIVITQDAVITLTQKTTTLNARARMRLADGTMIQRSTWGGKLSTEISATGYMPPGLDALNYDNPITISCIDPQSVTVAAPTLSAALPTARRTDAGSEPYGRAFLNNRWQDMTVTMNGDNAEWTAVPGATLYEVRWFAEFVAWVDEPPKSLQIGTGFSWSLKAEQQ